MKRMSKYLLVLLVFVLMTACSNKTLINNPTGENKPNDVVVNPNPDQAQVEVTLYFANKEYIQTGNEKLEKVLPEKRTITIGKMSKEEAVLKELFKGPTDSKLSNAIPSGVTLNNVQVVEKIAYVDFSRQNLNGGSLEESLIIKQIVKTLTWLDSVDKVQFLVNGKNAESLMGHIDITNPISE